MLHVKMPVLEIAVIANIQEARIRVDVALAILMILTLTPHQQRTQPTTDARDAPADSDVMLLAVMLAMAMEVIANILEARIRVDVALVVFSYSDANSASPQGAPAPLGAIWVPHRVPFGCHTGCPALWVPHKFLPLPSGCHTNFFPSGCLRAPCTLRRLH